MRTIEKSLREMCLRLRHCFRKLLRCFHYSGINITNNPWRANILLEAGLRLVDNRGQGFQRPRKTRVMNWWYENSPNLNQILHQVNCIKLERISNIWRDCYRVVDDEPFPSNLRTPSDSASCMWLKARRHYFITPLSIICQYLASPLYSLLNLNVTCI